MERDEASTQSAMATGANRRIRIGHAGFDIVWPDEKSLRVADIPGAARAGAAPAVVATRLAAGDATVVARAYRRGKGESTARAPGGASPREKRYAGRTDAVCARGRRIALAAVTRSAVAVGEAVGARRDAARGAAGNLGVEHAETGAGGAACLAIFWIGGRVDAPPVARHAPGRATRRAAAVGLAEEAHRARPRAPAAVAGIATVGIHLAPVRRVIVAVHERRLACADAAVGSKASGVGVQPDTARLARLRAAASRDALRGDAHDAALLRGTASRRACVGMRRVARGGGVGGRVRRVLKGGVTVADRIDSEDRCACDGERSRARGEREGGRAAEAEARHFTSISRRNLTDGCPVLGRPTRRV